MNSATTLMTPHATEGLEAAAVPASLTMNSATTPMASHNAVGKTCEQTGGIEIKHGTGNIHVESHVDGITQQACAKHAATRNGLQNRFSTGERVDLVLVSKNPNRMKYKAGMLSKAGHSASILLRRASSQSQASPNRVEGASNADDNEESNHDTELLRMCSLRNAFEVRMVVSMGLKVEKVFSRDQKHVFTLVHAPFKVLMTSAKEMRLYKKLRHDFVNEVEEGKYKDFLVGDLDKKCGTRFSTEMYTRGCYWFPCLLACSLQASRCVINGIPLGCPLSYRFIL